MKPLIQLLVISFLATSVSTEVLDYGELKKYEHTEQIPDGIHPNAIWLNPGKEGIDVILGKDLKDQVNSVMNACEKKNDDKCYQDVSKVLQDAHIQQDHNLDSRQIVVSAIVVGEVISWGIAAFKGAMAGLLIAAGIQGAKKLTETNWSEDDIKSAAKMPEAVPITLSADGSAVATVTHHAVSTALEGAITPHVEIVKDGGFAAVLDGDLAHRLEEFMRRSTDCRIGIDFDREHPDLKRSGGTLGQALCAAMGTMGGITQGGPFNDLLHIDPDDLISNLPAALPQPAILIPNPDNPSVADAVATLMDFVVEWAPVIALPEELIEQVAIYCLAMAIDAIVDAIPLGKTNPIQKETFTTTQSGPTKTDTATSTSSSASCPTDLICDMEEEGECEMSVTEKNKKATTVCKEGKNKDCECAEAPDAKISWASPEYIQHLYTLQSIFQPDTASKPDSKPQCDEKEESITAIPPKLFSGGDMDVHWHYCENWDKKKASKMLVDAQGNEAKPEGQSKLKRTPPPNQDSYPDWRFELSYTPSETGGECALDCNQTYGQFAKTCSVMTHISSMRGSGNYNVGCGEFAYKIIIPKALQVTRPPPSPPKGETTEEKPLQCWGSDDFKRTGDTEKKKVTGLAPKLCEWDGKPIKKGDKETFRQLKVKDKWPHGSGTYQFNIWWLDGCELQNGKDAMDVWNPKGTDSWKPGVCEDYLFRAYDECANGGRGGVFQVGCLMYEFSAYKKERKSFGQLHY